MTGTELKKEFRCFLLTDYGKEETFLREKHTKGYKLVKVTLPGLYYFEKCDPEDVIYKLDFNPQPVDERHSYVQMYKDYGWEYIRDLNEYSYFRKPACDTDDIDTEIFSDNQSRMEMLKRIFLKKMLPILAVFLLCGVPLAMNIALSETNGQWNVGFFILWGILFVFYLAIFVHCGIGFYRLRKSYSQRVD